MPLFEEYFSFIDAMTVNHAIVTNVHVSSNNYINTNLFSALIAYGFLNGFPGYQLNVNILY